MNDVAWKETPGPVTAEMPIDAKPEEPEKETRRKIAIICSKGSLDMAYPGLILANAAPTCTPGGVARDQLSMTLISA